MSLAGVSLGVSRVAITPYWSQALLTPVPNSLLTNHYHTQGTNLGNKPGQNLKSLTFETMVKNFPLKAGVQFNGEMMVNILRQMSKIRKSKMNSRNT